MRAKLAALSALAVVLAALPADAAPTGATPTPVAPANGASVRVQPPPGFANGDLTLRWSIVYDCPGPADIHSSYPQIRQAGSGGEFDSEQRGGPFLGNGTFSAPTSLFPKSVPVKYEWRVFWACGATENYAGEQGSSQVFTFTVLPTGPSAAELAAAKKRLAARLKQCARLRTRKQRQACVKKARADYARAIRRG
jgi:hypothetical protein